MSKKGPLGDFLEQAFIDWMGKTREVKTQQQFADYLGIERSLLNHYMNGRRNPPVETISHLVEILGPGILEAVGLSTKNLVDVQSIPRSFRERIRRASAEVNAIMAARGLTGESPEAEQITIQIFEKYGLKYTATEND